MAGLVVSSCTTNIEPSPQPGILKVTFQADSADTVIVIQNQTVRISSRDYFGVTIAQGIAYSGDEFAFLYTNPNNYSLAPVTYNIFEWDEDGHYQEFTIFESHVPPRTYQKIQFNMRADQVRVGFFQIPAELPPGASSSRALETSFEIFENRVTEVKIQISPFKSVTRYRDSYQFTPAMKILEVIYHK
jgi:hypothetical protein